MQQNMSIKNGPAQPLSFGEAIWQLPSQYIKVLSKPSADTLSEEIGKASWGIALVQFLALIVITVALGLLGHMIPSAALHTISALKIGSVQPFAFLPAPLNGITFVLGSFLIGLGTAYEFSKVSGGQGKFLTHFYCLLLFSVPLVTVSGLLLLIPASGWFALLPGSIVCALFIYRMVLHVFTITAVHDLSKDRATLIVLILPMVLMAILAIIMVIALFILSEGELIGGVFEPSFWSEVGMHKKKETSED